MSAHIDHALGTVLLTVNRAARQGADLSVEIGTGQLVEAARIRIALDLLLDECKQANAELGRVLAEEIGRAEGTRSMTANDIDDVRSALLDAQKARRAADLAGTALAQAYEDQDLEKAERARVALGIALSDHQKAHNRLVGRTRP